MRRVRALSGQITGVAALLLLPVGDYPGAVPDPAASSSATNGVVWMANMWNVANPNPTGGPAWRTWIFRVRP
jgi:hypothetical protein